MAEREARFRSVLELEAEIRQPTRDAEPLPLLVPREHDLRHFGGAALLLAGAVLSSGGPLRMTRSTPSSTKSTRRSLMDRSKDSPGVPYPQLRPQGCHQHLGRRVILAPQA